MNFKKIRTTSIAALLGAGLVLVGCNPTANPPVEETTENNTSVSKGAEYTKTLAATDWQGTRVYDAAGTDLTAENSDYIGLAKYDAASNIYEFYDKDTKASRGDEGTFFITADGAKRILISKTKNYQAIVDIKTLTNEMFTYKRPGVDKTGNTIDVFVDHIPYTESQLAFTNNREQSTATTGTIDTSKPGREILGSTLWSGTVVKDATGTDLTEANKALVNNLVKFDAATNKYEFFDVATGNTRGDYGYFDVVFNNKLLVLAATGQTKYGTVSEFSELSPQKFISKSTGKNASGSDVEVFVEYQPYTGTFNPTFSA